MKYFFIAAITFLSVPVSYGQNTLNKAAATASATIVTEMQGVEKLNDINFENIQVTTNQTSPGYDLIKSSNGFLKIIEGDYDYSITMPSTEITLQKAETFETMKVGSFKINYSIGNDNAKILFISANLSAGNSQQRGVYTSVTPITIIVNNN